jgi:general secretion pathway protein H
MDSGWSVPARHDGAVPTARRAGFTLIEMIVVLVILGLALSVVAAFIPRRNVTMELENATSRTAGMMRIARARAIAESRSISFQVSPDGHGLRVDAESIALGPEVKVATARGAAIVFTPDGGAIGGELAIAVDGRRRVIQVDPLTGRITVHDAS